MSIPSLIKSGGQRLAQIGEACGRAFGLIAKIQSGPGRGLRFDAGQYIGHIGRFVSGRYERPVQEALATTVRRGDVCYDVGANLGFFSILLSRLAGEEGSVYAFEPVPKNASTIERNAHLNRMDNIKVVRMALSSADGSEELLLADHFGGAVLKSAGTPPDLAGSLVVETATLDTLVERRRIKPPNIVKIDVEGAEMAVLKGMQHVLRQWSPTILLELDDESDAVCEEKVSACRSFLHGFDYRTEMLPDSYRDARWFVRHFLAKPAAKDCRAQIGLNDE